MITWILVLNIFGLLLLITIGRGLSASLNSLHEKVDEIKKKTDKLGTYNY